MLAAGRAEYGAVDPIKLVEIQAQYIVELAVVRAGVLNPAVG
jgi:hypothetical protein